MYLHGFNIHVSYHFVHLDAYKVQLSAFHMHLSLSGDGDTIWWNWSIGAGYEAKVVIIVRETN